MNKTLAAIFIFSLCILTEIYGQITFDGNITEPEWGTALSTSSGGPSPGFGAGHELNAIYSFGDDDNIYFGIAGNVQDGNRILLFIDSKSGGYNDGDFGRADAPQGIDDFNSGTTFDSGFFPDYCLVIGTNGAMDNYFFDLYTLSGTSGSGGGPNNFLGDSDTDTDLGADPVNSNNTRGFEASILKTAIGYIDGNINIMAMYTSDNGFLSNQFLTPAGSGDGNYGNGAVTFGAATPNPITIPEVVLPVELLRFNGKATSNAIVLTWTTSSEIDNQYFTIERSQDTKTWSTVGKVTGNGTSLSTHHYTFEDKDPHPKLNYYRLKQVDFDGSFDYSELIFIPFDSDKELGTTLVYPNLVQDQIFIENGVGELLVYNLMGRVIKQVAITSSFSIVDATSFLSGRYLLQLNKSDGQVMTKWLVKQ